MFKKEKFWPILCEHPGRPEWADDKRFRTFKDRLANRELVNRLVAEALSARITAEWLLHFAGQVPAAPINDPKQALDNKFVEERSRIAGYGDTRTVAGQIVDALAAAPREPAPAPGADTDAILRDSGYSASEIAALRRDRLI